MLVTLPILYPTPKAIHAKASSPYHVTEAALVRDGSQGYFITVHTTWVRLDLARLFYSLAHREARGVLSTGNRAGPDAFSSVFWL